MQRCAIQLEAKGRDGATYYGRTGFRLRPALQSKKKQALICRGSPIIMSDDKSAAAYWAANVRVIKICLLVWALVSFGFGILLRPVLQMLPLSVGGTDLGFWFAQQGSILTFIALIFYYTWYMNRLDREFGVEEE
jgi:putative solute:sodium symporter small subunit